MARSAPRDRAGPSPAPGVGTPTRLAAGRRRGVPRPRAGDGPARSRAFTLIEAVAVLALTAVLAGTAAVVLSGPRARAAAADAVDQLVYTDGAVRRAAVAAGQPQSLVIDLAHGRLARGDTTLADLPAGVAVVRVLANGEAVDSGTATVPVTAAGRSASYAVGLSTPAGARWVVVAGLSGRATAVADGDAAQAAVDLTRPAVGF